MQSKLAIVFLLAAITSARQLSGPKALLKRQSSYCPASSPTDCGSDGCAPAGAVCCPGSGGHCDAGEECQQGDNGVTGCCPEGETCTGDADPIPSIFSIPSISIPDFSDYTSYNPDAYTSYLPSDFTIPTDFPTINPSDYTSYLPSDFSLPTNFPTNFQTHGGSAPAPTQASGGNGGSLGVQGGGASAGNAVRPLAQPLALLGAAAMGGFLL